MSFASAGTHCPVLVSSFEYVPVGFPFSSTSALALTSPLMSPMPISVRFLTPALFKLAAISSATCCLFVMVSVPRIFLPVAASKPMFAFSPAFSASPFHDLSTPSLSVNPIIWLVNVLSSVALYVVPSLYLTVLSAVVGAVGVTGAGVVGVSAATPVGVSGVVVGASAAIPVAVVDGGAGSSAGSKSNLPPTLGGVATGATTGGATTAGGS